MLASLFNPASYIHLYTLYFKKIIYFPSFLLSSSFPYTSHTATMATIFVIFHAEFLKIIYFLHVFLFIYLAIFNLDNINDEYVPSSFWSLALKVNVLLSRNRKLYCFLRWFLTFLMLLQYFLLYLQTESKLRQYPEISESRRQEA